MHPGQYLNQSMRSHRGPNQEGLKKRLGKRVDCSLDTPALRKGAEACEVVVTSVADKKPKKN
jgi:hypothetical protein